MAIGGSPAQLYSRYYSSSQRGQSSLPPDHRLRNRARMLGHWAPRNHWTTLPTLPPRSAERTFNYEHGDGSDSGSDSTSASNSDNGEDGAFPLPASRARERARILATVESDVDSDEEVVEGYGSGIFLPRARTRSSRAGQRGGLFSMFLDLQRTDSSDGEREQGQQQAQGQLDSSGPSPRTIDRAQEPDVFEWPVASHHASYGNELDNRDSVHEETVVQAGQLDGSEAIAPPGPLGRTCNSLPRLGRQLVILEPRRFMLTLTLLVLAALPGALFWAIIMKKCFFYLFGRPLSTFVGWLIIR